MNLGLTGQGAVVIGGASGIGRAIAEAFVAEGCRVGVLDLKIDDLPAGITGMAGDVTDDAAMREAAMKFQSELGGVRHVVFAAGCGSGKFGFPFWNLDPSDWPRVLAVNLLGAVNAAHAFAPMLTLQRAGTMLFVVSVAGQMGSQTDPPYSAAKAGLINFMQCVAKDFAPFNVRANALSPGMVKTGLNKAVWAAGQAGLPETQRQDYETWAAEKIRKVSPLGRWQEPEEFGAMAVFLASDHARNVTGQTLNVDGGQIMHS